MTTTTTSSALVPARLVFTEPERLALAGFLAGYSGLTREAYALDLRQFAAWCHRHHRALFAARRADIECFGRDLEAAGRARATVTAGCAPIAGFYRYAVEEELLEHNPAVRVRRPRLDYESHATGLDRNEVGARFWHRFRGPRTGRSSSAPRRALTATRWSLAHGRDVAAVLPAGRRPRRAPCARITPAGARWPDLRGPRGSGSRSWCSATSRAGERAEGNRSPPLAI